MTLKLPGFTIVTLLKEGIKAVLYRGIRVEDRRPVIIKGLRPECCTPNNIEQLRHEYAIAQRLNTPGAVKAYVLEVHQGIPYLILEDFGGRSLDRLLEDFREPIPFLKIAIQITNTIAQIHSHSIVHKNIKPQNILINLETHQVKIADFGIAAFIPYEQQMVSSSSQIAGSLAYLSPEQTGRMNRGIDHRSDLYSLGVTFYEMLTRQLPFQGKDPLEWVHCHIAQSPPPLTKVRPEIGRSLSDIIMKLLSKVAEDRYQSALGLQFDLERCLKQLETIGQIQSFPLGEQDISERFQIPQKLYGREREIAQLLQAFERVVSQGTPELIFVAGYAGIGKSSLVNEIQKPIVRERGIFISGKFDQYKRDIPYSTLVQAFQTLVRQILTEPEDKLATWRKRIQAAFGNNGRLITDVIPEVELIVGEQPPVPDLGPAESQNRFNLVFQNFISIFAQKEHPLAVFLDDMQWADSATLNLIQTITTGSNLQHLCFILAFRDNEVDLLHPFSLMMEQIRQGGAKITEIVLTPLNLTYVNQLIAETLHCEPGRSESLAKLIIQKTDGNPFFVNEFLKTLYQENLLTFDRNHRVWQWEQAQIEAQGITDNIVNLMIGRMQKLPPETQQLLKLASCIGNRFDLEVLAIVGETSLQQTANTLLEAVLRGFIIPTEATESIEKSYRFYHDRIQQAAYALIDDEQKQAVHLTIGRLLLKSFNSAQLEEQIFDLVNQLNLAVGLITERTEKDELIRLNLIAAKKAKASTAYTPAKKMLAVAANLLNEDSWFDHYEQTFTLVKERAECEFLTGNLEEAEALFKLLFIKAKSYIDKANIYILQLRLYQVAGRYEEALALGLEALKIFGVTFPDSEEQVQVAIAIEKSQVLANLGDRQVSDLLNAPTLQDPNLKTLIGLLTTVGPPAYLGRPSIFPLVVLKAVNYSLTYGNTEDSCFAYSMYAMLLVSIFRDIPTGYAFSEMTIQLNEKLNDPKLRGTVLHIHGSHINVWRNHIATDIPFLERGFIGCVEAGDVTMANYNGYQGSWQIIQVGSPLPETYNLIQKYVNFAQQSKHEAAYQTIRLQQQFLINLRGFTYHKLTLSDDSFDESHAFSILTDAGFVSGIIFYHIIKLIVFFTYEQYEEALNSALQVSVFPVTTLALPIETDYVLYHSLTLATLYPTASCEEQEGFLETLEMHQRQLQDWASHCPANFLHKSQLVAAEIARIEGRDMEAMRLYEQSIRCAREQKFVHYEALAYELAAKFYLDREFEAIAKTYLQEARNAYRRWEALGKVKQLEQLYPTLLPQPLPQQPPASNETFLSTGEQLDFLSVVKASQTISSEIVFSRLLKTLMQIALEQAGAELGYLLLFHEQNLVIEVEAKINSQAEKLNVFRPELAGEIALPQSVLNYVQRTQSTVILPDATEQNLFSEDEYVIQKQPKSVLCLPITRQSNLLGILYLENNFIPGAFTHDKLSVLEILAAQIAISLENARLYQGLAQSQEQLNLALKSAQIGIWSWDILNDRFDWDEQIYQLFGVTPETFVATSEAVLARLHPDDRESLAQSLNRAVNEGVEHDLEYRIIQDDGSIRYAACRGRAFFNEAGTATRMSGVVIDITERKQTEESLLISKAALEQMPDAVVLTDLEGNIQRWLGNAEQIFGYTASEAIAKPLNFLHHPDIAATMTAQIIQSIQETGGFCREIPCVRKDGSKVLIETTSKLVYDKAGKPLFLVCINKDISERKQAEAERAQLYAEQTARQEAEADRQRAAFLAQVSATLASSLDYESTLSSVASLVVPYFADWCGVDLLQDNQSIHRVAVAHRDPEKVKLAWELHQRYPRPLNAPEGVPKVLRTGQTEMVAEISDAVLAEAVKDPEHLRILRELGLKSYIISPLMARGRILGAISFVTAESAHRFNTGDLSLAEDIAHRAAIAIDNARLYREAQQAQQTAERAAERIARLQSITAALSESLTPTQVSEVIVEQGMAALGANYALVALLNESGTELEIVRAVGYEVNQIDGWQRFSIDTAVPLAEAVRTGQPVWGETSQKRAARYPHLAEAYSQFNFGTWVSIPLMVEGRAVGGLSLGFTEPQELNEDDQAFILALAQQCAQAIARSHLYEAERTARSAAEAANRVKDEFLAVLSHELRTPLNPILGWAKLLRSRKFDAATSDRALETIERNAKLQTQLIEDLLDVSRILQGKLSLNVYPVDLVSTIEAAIETVRLAAEAKSIQIQTILEPDVGQVSGDANRLQQVVWNLLANAVKFTPAGGQVAIALEQVGSQAQIRVTDTGKGIAPEFLPYVFDYFRQEDGTTTRTFGGLGLGLAIVRHLVELHGGTVSVSSPGEGQGATFLIKLPCLQNDRERQSDEKDNLSVLTFDSLPLSGLQILVVDDDADMREFLCFLLEQYGATVTSVASAVAALTTLSQSQPNVIISDIGMPEINGYMLMRQVRSLKPDQGGNIPAIALTAYAAEMDYQQAIAAGFQQHISKPVEPEALVKAIASLLFLQPESETTKVF
ncbi:AAA family ATPase [Coleofasciculus sp. FACHB-T130]|uniref:AAA family ATPase n=1 Tax=Cyanophyceae TaxID=3028117 RepID=UPI0016858DF4|nr:AAA family ATPase [Coleofasciculus sp. FACHB-T130]MBD1879142.1 AAA family ATPase [Coleofasciculus sp. FACHB-T130]